MALDDTWTINRTNQQNQTGDNLGLIIERFNGLVEGTLNRKSLMKGWVPLETVTGTSTLRSDAVGESTIQVLQPGVTPDGTRNDFAKNQLVIDTVVLARAAFYLLDQFQNNYNKQAEVANEHGKKLGKLFDQAMFIQAVKASLRTESAYSNGSNGKPAGHFGGNIQTLTAAGDATDPAKLYQAIADLMVKMELKDVDPQMDDCVMTMRPDVFYTLLQAEQLINGEYITANGNTVKGMILQAYGIPALRSNNYVAGTNVTAHPLSTAANSNGYNGDFTKAVLSIFAPRALMAGETIPLTSEVFYDQTLKQWFVDAHMSYGATTKRAEFSGSIYKP